MPSLDLGIEVLSLALHETAPPNHNIGEGLQRAICDSAEAHNTRAEAMLSIIVAAMNQEHIVEFSETGYGLQHPFKCRPDLLGCAYNKFLDARKDSPHPTGRFAMHLSHSSATYRLLE